MSQEIKRRRGTTAQHAAFTGAVAELTVDTDKNTVVVHDGVTLGGVPLAREDMSNVNVDAWGSQPIGVPIPLYDGVSLPPTDQSYRYIVLTAADAYNTGVLISESVTGSAPLIVATAQIDLDESPLDGATVHLINTERRFLRAGSAGTAEDDAMQGHWHTQRKTNLAAYTSGSTGRDTVTTSPANADAGTGYITGPISDGTNGTPRTATETRPRNVGVSYVMRIL